MNTPKSLVTITTDENEISIQFGRYTSTIKRDSPRYENFVLGYLNDIRREILGLKKESK